MKKLINCIVVLLTFVTMSAANNIKDVTFQIMKLNTPTITIAGKALKIGDTFKDPASIKWVDDKQSMEVKDLATGALYRFSRQVLEGKGESLSIKDFFLRTTKASSRDTDFKISLAESPAKAQFPDKRLALVIGNSNYFNLSYLRNAQKDATDVASALLSLGFDVLQIYECTYNDMKSALNKFSSMASDYDVALFYFAGHGLQEDGKNYLIPINAALEYRSELAQLLNCDDIVDRMDAAGTPSRLIFLDACRNAKKSWSRDVSEGLARMEGTPGSVIVFSTQSGKVALDGEGDNSPFAASLIQNIVKPNLTFSDAMNSIVRDTYTLTDQRQYPLLVGTLFDDFRFNPGEKEIKTDVKAVPAKPAPTERQPQPVASQPKQSSQLPKPVVDFSEPGFDVKVTNAYREGSFAIFDVLLTNNTSKDYRMSVHYKNDGVTTSVYANSSQIYYTNTGLTIKVGDIDVASSDFVDLPVGMPVALRFTVRNFPQGITSIPMVRVAFYLLDSFKAIHPTLRITNIPFGDKATAQEESSTQNENASPTMQSTFEGFDVRPTMAVYSGNFAIFEITLTNNTSRDCRMSVHYKNDAVTTSVYASPSQIFYTNTGLSIKVGDMDVASSDFADLPVGMPVTLRFTVRNFPRGLKSIPMVRVAFHLLDSGSRSTHPTITIANLPFADL
ncbi:MAG: caspase family protein [Muribaculaceae bacterium]|nr:caspase family protein [Muribaculaceae bacterium]